MVASQAGGEEGIKQGRNSLSACGSSPGVMLVIIPVVCHSFISLICPSLDSSSLGLVFWGFICDDTQQTGWKAYCYFLSFIPQWLRTHMKVPEVQALLFLFPSTVFVFFRVQLNCSLRVLEFKLSHHICGQVCTEFTEFGKHRGGSQFSYRLLFSLTSLLLAENGDGPCSQPCKV